jgi:excisionase family DNA binding protein
MSRSLVFLKQAHEHRPWATERFLRTLIANGQIARHRVGGRVLVDLDELDELAERGRVEPAPLRLVAEIGRRRAAT